VIVAVVVGALGVVQVRPDLVEHLLAVGRLPVVVDELVRLQPREVVVGDVGVVLAVTHMPVLGATDRRGRLDNLLCW
jgi:hypothetical protein